MEVTRKEIIERCGLSPSTVKLLEDMDEETYKEIAREVIFLAKPVVEQAERDRIRQVVTKVLNGKAIWINRYDVRAILEEALKVE